MDSAVVNVDLNLDLDLNLDSGNTEQTIPSPSQITPVRENLEKEIYLVL